MSGTNAAAALGGPARPPIPPPMPAPLAPSSGKFAPVPYAFERSSSVLSYAPRPVEPPLDVNYEYLDEPEDNPDFADAELEFGHVFDKPAEDEIPMSQASLAFSDAGAVILDTVPEGMEEAEAGEAEELNEQEQRAIATAQAAVRAVAAAAPVAAADAAAAVPQVPPEVDQLAAVVELGRGRTQRLVRIRAVEKAAEAARSREEDKRLRAEEAEVARKLREEARAAREKAAAEKLKRESEEAARKARFDELARRQGTDVSRAAREIRAKPDYESSVGSTGTIATKQITSDIRFEVVSPERQARIIHGEDTVNERMRNRECCALCGFPFEFRMGRQRKTKGQLSISYDHFIPVNFAAIVFRVVLPRQTYSANEFAIFKTIGDMVCWHCNYEKSQRMFITCLAGDFSGMRPNEGSIRAYLNKMLTSTHASGVDQNGKSTLLQCIANAGITPAEWVEQRMGPLMARAQEVSETIRKNVDYNHVRNRFLAAKLLISIEDKKMLSDPIFNKLKADKKYTERRSRIAKAFANLEPSFDRPWNAKVRIDSPAASSIQPFALAPCVQSAKAKAVAAAAVQAAEAVEAAVGKRKGAPPVSAAKATTRRRGSGRRKTHRRRKLPKLL